MYVYKVTYTAFNRVSCIVAKDMKIAVEKTSGDILKIEYVGPLEKGCLSDDGD